MKQPQYSLLLLLLFLSNYNLNTTAQTIVPAGSVSGNWNLAGSPYQIKGHIFIVADSKLTIDPGVTVEFQGHYKFNIQGCLIAVGTVTDSIFFTAADTSAGWWGLRYDKTPATQDSSIFMYCKFQYGKATGNSDDIYGPGGAIGLKDFSKIRIMNCLFINNTANYAGGAIACDNSSPIIRGNTITYNIALGYTGGGIYCWGASPNINRNIISNNSAINNTGGGIGIENTSSPLITGNIISNNFAAFQGGGIHLASAGNSFILSNNYISNNTAGTYGGGIYCWASSNAPFMNNVICNNTAGSSGGGIACDFTPPKIINCTIVNNLANSSDENNGGGGIYFTESSPLCKNVIIYGNKAKNGNGNSVFLNDNNSNPPFSYCDIEGGKEGFWTNGYPYSGSYANNLDAAPNFTLASQGAGAEFDGLMADWSLQSISPCIDAGNSTGLTVPPKDIAGNQRISGNYIDIGAYEYQQNTGVQDKIPSDNLIQIYPNPNSGNFFIKSQSKIISIEILDVLGIQVYNQIINSSQSEVNVNSLVKGIYFVNIKSYDGKSTQGKIVIE